MTGTSTAAGPLLPEVSAENSAVGSFATGNSAIASNGAAPLEGGDLIAFIQTWLASVMGMDGSLLRPAWQPDPAAIPVAGQYWAALQIRQRRSDNNVVFLHNPDAADGEGTSTLLRNEDIDVLLSFYDLGANGQADAWCSLLMDGLQVAQNREVLDLNGFAFITANNPVAVPVLFKERWLYRVDLALLLRRRISREYNIRNVLGLTGTLVPQPGPSVTLTNP